MPRACGCPKLCGLRLSDCHFVASAAHLGCRVPGPHLHVVRREDNENGALAKSAYPRVVPVARELVWAYNAYRAERDQVPAAAESDYVLVNLFRAPLGRALSPGSVEAAVRPAVRQGRLQGQAAHAPPQLRLRRRPGDQGPRVGERSCWGTLR